MYRVLLLCVLVACGKGSPPEVASAPALEPSPETPTEIDTAPLVAHLADLAKHDRWQGSVALFDGDRAVVTHSEGTLEPGGAAVDADTRFRIGSITKVYTATVIFQLVDEGKLSLEDPLANWFPNIPNATEITLEQMLDHHSGLFSFTDAPDYKATMTEPATQDELVARIASYDPSFEPGAEAGYSNSAFVLLGFVIEAIEDKPYGEVVQTRILDRLATTRTGYGGNITPAANEVRSLDWKGDGWEVATQTDMSVPGAAGALVSTPTEMCRFARELFAGDLVSAESLDTMQTLEDGFGHGLFRFPYGERWAWGHNGGIDGFSSMLAYLPEDDRCFALTTHGQNTQTNDIAIVALHTLYGVPWEAPTVTSILRLTVEQLEPFVGTYSSKTVPIELTIAVDGALLTAQGTGQSAFPLTPVAENEFVFEPAGVRLVFAEPGKMTLVQVGKHAFVREE